MEKLEYILISLSNPIFVIGMFLAIILIWSLYFIGKKYPRIEVFKIWQKEKDILEKIDVISSDEQALIVIYHNKHILGYDNDEKIVSNLIGFHEQFSNENAVKSFYTDTNPNFDMVLTKQEIKDIEDKSFRDKYNFVIKKYRKK